MAKNHSRFARLENIRARFSLERRPCLRIAAANVQNLEHLDALATMEFNRCYHLNLSVDDLKGVIALLLLETNSRKSRRTRTNEPKGVILKCPMLDDFVEARRWGKWRPAS